MGIRNSWWNWGVSRQFTRHWLYIRPAAVWQIEVEPQPRWRYKMSVAQVELETLPQEVRTLLARVPFIRAVREEMIEYVVTLRGEPVAVLRPLTNEEAQRLRQVEIDTALAEMKALAQEVASAWTSEKSGAELVAEQRR
jgi:antitoxin (DNA-binding transcriptional repressor) of toxin-antitoxin stability system